MDSFDQLNTKILNEIKDIVKKHQGYITLIKVEEDLKASADIFTIDPIKYKISEKIKKVLILKEFLTREKCTQEFKCRHHLQTNN